MDAEFSVNQSKLCRKKSQWPESAYHEAINEVGKDEKAPLLDYTGVDLGSRRARRDWRSFLTMAKKVSRSS